MTPGSRNLAASGAVGALAAMLFFASVAVREAAVDPMYEQREARPESSFPPSPGPEILGILSMGHALAAADLLWLDVVQQLGRAIEGEKVDDEVVITAAHAATDLDPRYFVVYQATAVNLSVYSRRVDASDALLRKGWSALPERWELPFLLGYNQYFIRGDTFAAAELWKRASELPDPPRFLLSLAARARYQTGDETGAVQMLEQMLPYLSGPAKRDAELRLIAFRSEPRLSLYDAACRAYLERHGELPSNARALRERGLVGEPPEDLAGNPIRLDEDCRARTDLVRVREDEAFENATGGHGAKPNYLDFIREQESERDETP